MKQNDIVVMNFPYNCNTIYLIIIIIYLYVSAN